MIKVTLETIYHKSEMAKSFMISFDIFNVIE